MEKREIFALEIYLREKTYLKSQCTLIKKEI